MKFNYLYLAVVSLLTFSACSDDETTPAPVVYEQEDQMARPAINTVFIAAGDPKNVFNQTIPSAMGAAYAAAFQTGLETLNANYTGVATNALGLTSSQFAGVLATDVLTVSLTGTTTFFDGTNVLTGRALADDVISTELLLIFGGSDGMSNPGLTDDHVDANDKAFLSTFPYLAAPF